jgi:SPASM domain peptide maturase of grasp-with-spasm system
MYIILFPFVKITVGHTRAVIANLRDNFYLHIPNSFAQLFAEGYAEEMILDSLNEEDKATVEEYFRFLITKNLAYRAATLHTYNQWMNGYQSPYPVEQAILDYTPASAYNLSHAISEISDMGCPHLQLRFYNYTDYTVLLELFPLLSTTSFSSIALVAPFCAGIAANKQLLAEVFSDLRFTITLYGAPRSKTIRTAVFTSQQVISEHSCGIISPTNFSLSVSTFLLSQSHNTCLYKKISIDRNGYMKACPSQREHQGMYAYGKLADAYQAIAATSTGSITKDMITTCKDCEYRHICTDCRAYLSNPEDAYSKPLKCGYDPYTQQWRDWRTEAASQYAFQFYQLPEIHAAQGIKNEELKMKH